jgi:radical SAM protein with 4Fe4S-binding SPASM domain
MSKYNIDKLRRMDDTKLLWHMDRVKARFDRKERVAPIHIDMGIAKFCNVACVFCYGMYQTMSKDLIQRDTLLTTMRGAAKIGVKSIAIVGDGEPTVNPHFYEALRVGKDAGLDLSTSTNGVLLTTDDRLLAILESCQWMRFCISAGTKEGYLKIHQRDRFDVVVKNIKRAVELKEKYNLPCEIGLQAVFVPTIMIEEMIEESKLAVLLGVDYFVIKQCSLPDDGSTGMAVFDVKDYDNQQVDEALKICEALSNKRTQIIPKWNLIKQKGQKPYNNCSSIALISEISGNGDWYPCGYMFGNKPEFQQYKFGNLHEQTLEEIWNSEKYWQIVEHMENTFNIHTECHGCCRQDKCNEFCYIYRNPPKGINFI